MKILKYIFLLLLLCGVAGFVFIATQPGEYTITKSKEISASKDVVFNFVNDYNNWYLWNANIDSTSSKELFSEDSKTYTISNGNESIIYETLKLYNSDSISQKLTQDNLTHNLVWKFTTTQKGTLLSCEMKGTMTLKQKVFSVLQGGAQNYLGDDIQKSLTNIEKYLTNQLNKFNIKIYGLATKEGTLFIKQIDSSSTKNFSSISRNKIPELIKFAKENSINYTEAPFVLFDYWNTTNNKTKFSICLPVKEEIITSEGSDVLGGELFEYRAIKVTLTGDYSHIRKAWDEGFKYIERNKLTIDTNGSYIESYKVSAPSESEPSKWVTDIYIPIKADLAPKKKPITNVSIEPVLETQPIE
ncbi:GyrI-like domain-containing protein [uncultured Flavobacterium sp.]|uniref:GyrI-like domain-containing protein n=1 Tax=uncultured Flavobacterium sp. TaxID=165435 RepID=UPI0030ED1FB3|tara:strand:+ start:48491 stop:49564 length:1074 start_codon:yes stop_codon:yes gene_type:complete